MKKTTKIALIGGATAGLVGLNYYFKYKSAEENSAVRDDDAANIREAELAYDSPWIKTTDVSEEGRYLMSRYRTQRDLFMPVQHGGLRTMPGDEWLDSRFTRYAKLKGELKAKDQVLHVNPSLTELDKMFERDKIYRVVVEGEEMLIRRVGGTACQILERPHMSNWRNPHVASYRDPVLDAEGNEIWPQYQIPNPVYSEAIRREFLRDYVGRSCVQEIETGEEVSCQAMTLGNWRNRSDTTVWVMEIMKNCAAPMFDNMGEYRTWDPVLGDCRPMTAEEIADTESRIAAQEERERQRQRERQSATDDLVYRLWGMSQRGKDVLDGLMRREDCNHRRVSMMGRVDWSMPSDIEAYAWDVMDPSYTRVEIPFTERADETVAQRRRRGETKFRELDSFQRQQMRLDWSCLQYGFGERRSSALGEGARIGVGGFYGFVAVSRPVRSPVYGVLHSTRVLGRQFR
jgi:hypothetical protein